MTEDEAFEQSLGKLVSNRNHFTGSEQYVGLIVSLFSLARAKNMSDEDVTVRVNDIVQQIVGDCVWSFSTAARNGMEQAAELICSPKYNKILSDRHQREMKRRAEERDKWRAENLARRTEKLFKQAGGKPVQ